MAANYAREKFTDGLDILARWPGDIRQGLLDAYQDEVSHARSDKQVPPAIARRIEALHRRMTSVAGKGEEGSIAATVKAMTDAEVVAAVDEIKRIAREL
jgi:hypothetical protein